MLGSKVTLWLGQCAYEFFWYDWTVMKWSFLAIYAILKYVSLLQQTTISLWFTLPVVVNGCCLYLEVANECRNCFPVPLMHCNSNTFIISSVIPLIVRYLKYLWHKDNAWCSNWFYCYCMVMFCCLDKLSSQWCKQRNRSLNTYVFCSSDLSWWISRGTCKYWKLLWG